MPSTSQPCTWPREQSWAASFSDHDAKLMFFAIKWHYDQGKKKKQQQVEKAGGAPQDQTV